MEVELLEGNKLKVTKIFDLNEKFDSYYEELFKKGFDSFQREMVEVLAKDFMKKYGDTITDQLKEKMLTDWVKVFESDVLQKALKEVMNKNNY